MRGGRALPKYFGTFSRGAFLRRGVPFFENANNLSLKLFLGCISIIPVVGKKNSVKLWETRCDGEMIDGFLPHFLTGWILLQLD